MIQSLAENILNGKGPGLSDTLNGIGQGLNLNKLPSTNQNLRDELGIQDLSLALENSGDSYVVDSAAK